ncbi:prepilin peptidase [Longimicrobium sp.]|uniref:prepilin peptidase n=1 Tax=Longimicrobium sp. TaxID=2029185 RepID=UPI002E37D628|nr:prepilin peptidase [Longimicrobium sp.]HEX6037795.1 prepilin peptidase [Longimicrobium sp.]
MIPAATALLLGAAVPAGALAGAWWAAVARRIPAPHLPLYQPRPHVCAWPAHLRRWDPAQTAGAGIPLAAALVTPGPGAAAAGTLVGWLFLGIAVCDERTLRIPHLPWVGGIVAGLGLAGAAGGWAGVADRVFGVLALIATIFALAALARLTTGRDAMGAGDYGVLACVGAVCGAEATLDIVLLASLFALASITAGQRTRPLLRGSAAPAPFGACLVAATLCILLAADVVPCSAPESVRGDFVLRHLLS